MSPPARALLALAAAALLRAACADDSDPLPNDNVVDNCARLVIGKRTAKHYLGAGNKMPVRVTERNGQVFIPRVEWAGSATVGRYVLLCNKAGPIPPLVFPLVTGGDLDSQNLSIFVHLPDGHQGPANMEMKVWYFYDTIRHNTGHHLGFY